MSFFVFQSAYRFQLPALRGVSITSYRSGLILLHLAYSDRVNWIYLIYIWGFLHQHFCDRSNIILSGHSSHSCQHWVLPCLDVNFISSHTTPLCAISAEPTFLQAFLPRFILTFLHSQVMMTVMLNQILSKWKPNVHFLNTERICKPTWENLRVLEIAWRLLPRPKLQQ